MFPNASPAQQAQKTAARLHTAIEGWRSTADSWFDGTPAAVNRRIAGCDALIHRLRSAGTHTSGTVSELVADREYLVGLHHSMNNAHQDRELPARRTAASRNPRVIVEARAFVRENLNAIHAPAEIRERALRHADRHGMGSDFVASCVEIAKSVPPPRMASAPTMVEDFPDHGLFM